MRASSRRLLLSEQGLRRVAFACFLLMGLASGPAPGADRSAPGAGISPEQQAWLRRANRHEKHGWIYLHIEGAPRERGFQHGYLLAPEIAESVRVIRALWVYGSAMEWSWFVEKTSAFLEPNIAAGSMTADRGVVLGHNSMVDYPEAGYNVVLDIQPAKGHRILMQAAPGLIHSGTDFFVTDAGLVGSETTIGNFDGFEEQGVAEFARMRRATQDASSIDEWCEIIQRGNNGGYANAWLLGDTRSGEIARLELGLKHAGLEKKRDGYFVGSNIAENLKVLRFETDANETDVRVSAIARRVRWKALLSRHAGRINAQLAKQFEADHYDSYLEREHPGGRSLCGHFELDAQFWGVWPGAPFYPAGTFDAKVVDSKMAKQMSFAGRWGSACGRPFDAEKFLTAHPQFDWMRGLLKSRPAQPWAVFRAGEQN